LKKIRTWASGRGRTSRLFTQAIGALGITEVALSLAGVRHNKGGVQAALDYIASRTVN
jgi:hypothetical protein